MISGLGNSNRVNFILETFLLISSIKRMYLYPELIQMLKCIECLTDFIKIPER